MRTLGFGSADQQLHRLLILGAHCDDAEIGAGGTIRTFLQRWPRMEIRWVVFAAGDQRGQEAVVSAREIIGQGPGRSIETHAFRDGFFPYEGALIKEAFERLKLDYAPDLILTHHREDLHQDHRILAELTWNTYRDHWILEYEVPKYDGGLGSPNFFVPLTPDIVDAKVDGLMRSYGSQRSKSWFTAETFRALMRLRGIECRSESGYAEGFYVRKVVWEA